MELTSEMVKELRKALGETAEEFGRRFNVTRKTVYLWESPGGVTPTQPKKSTREMLLELYREVCGEREPTGV